MAERVVIERRFRGPPQSANGGYACGLLAAPIEAPAVEATLRAPPPLDRPLPLERLEDGGTELRDGDELIGEARPAPAPELELPAPVAIEAAEEARRTSPLHRMHAFPGCFVCGPEREAGDGMRAVCGPVPGREGELVAAPWEVGTAIPSEDGVVREEIVWAALDCPTGLAGLIVPDLGVTVLGRLTATLERPVEVGRTYVSIGWPLEREGRKLHSASAILDPDDPGGAPLARARATWIELRDQPRAESASAGAGPG